MNAVTGYHLTTKEAWKSIKSGGLKGSKWTDDMGKLQTMTSNPFNLYRDGAVWCYPSLEVAKANQEDGEVILKITGMGLVVEHDAHGTCVVGKANLCKATLVRANAKVNNL